jgi:hypothetical protein
LWSASNGFLQRLSFLQNRERDTESKVRVKYNVPWGTQIRLGSEWFASVAKRVFDSVEIVHLVWRHGQANPSKEQVSTPSKKTSWWNRFSEMNGGIIWQFPTRSTQSISFRRSTWISLRRVVWLVHWHAPYRLITLVLTSLFIMDIDWVLHHFTMSLWRTFGALICSPIHLRESIPSYNGIVEV